MMIVTSSGRVIAAVAIVCTIFVVYRWNPEKSDQVLPLMIHSRPGQVADESTFHVQPAPAAESSPLSADEPSAPPVPAPASVPAFTVPDDVHRLPTADAFRPHIESVLQVPGMTMEEAKSGCTWGPFDQVNFQYVDNDWVRHDRSDLELDSHRTQWHDFVRTGFLPYEMYKDQFSGRGIVIVGGHEKSLNRIHVLLRALIKVGSRLPIELHYWAEELTEESKAGLVSVWPGEMYFNDLSAPTNILAGQFNLVSNYQFKTAAMVNSRFAEPLLLDSDNIPIIPPEDLYESDVYQEYGTIFWPDAARTRPNNPMWAITNTQCRMDEYEQESGQLLVDKRRYFYHLQLAAWFNNDPNYYYNGFLLGDKDMFRFAWHALKTKFGSPARWLTSIGTLSDDGYYCGHTFAQHHPDGRIAFLHGGALKTMAKEVMQWQRETRGGVFQAYKRSPSDQSPNVSVRVGIKWDPATWLPNKPADIKITHCTDMPDVTARPLDEIIPGFEKVFEDIGGYWVLDD